MGLDLSQAATEILRDLAAPKESGYIQYVPVGGIQDKLTGLKSNAISEPIPVNAALLGVDKSFKGDTRILETDQMILMDNEVVPDEDGRFLVDNIPFTIISIKPLNHAGILQLTKVVVRG